MSQKFVIGQKVQFVIDNTRGGAKYGDVGDEFVIESIVDKKHARHPKPVYEGTVIYKDGSGEKGDVWANEDDLAEISVVKEPVQEDQWDEKLRGVKMSDTTGFVIFKYQMPVLESFEMKLPQGARIIRVEDQGGMFWMWALVNTNVPDETRKFYSFKCGGKIPENLNIDDLVYIGFCKIYVQQELGLYIFEEVKK